MNLPPTAAALRPKQYTKNLLLFAALIFADRMGSIEAWIAATAAFVAYCSASSAAYLLNDVRDAPEDRQHPVKRLRPIARGDLSPRVAFRLGAALVVVAVAATAALGAGSLVLLAAFLGLQAVYSAGLKSLVFVDVAAIGGLFVIRAAAGAQAVDVPVSGWLIVLTALLASFLALSKRRAERAVVATGRTPGRASIRRYTVAGLDRLLTAFAVATVAAYVAYAAFARTPLMLLTAPFVAYGLARYIDLVRHQGYGEEPENVLLTDLRLIVTVLCWAVVAGAVIALS